MRSRRLLNKLTFLVTVLLWVNACFSTRQDASLTLIVVRHAEKMSSTDADPPLSAEGLKRAEALALALRDYPVVAVYATPFRRTQTTAAPTALRFGVPVQSYDAKLATTEFADTLRAQHSSGAVLVVGHSNTVPQIVSVLCDSP
jgi:broad specificity phosphatase PhoE